MENFIRTLKENFSILASGNLIAIVIAVFFGIALIYGGMRNSEINNKSFKVLFLGLDNAGKSVIIKSIDIHTLLIKYVRLCCTSCEKAKVI